MRFKKQYLFAGLATAALALICPLSEGQAQTAAGFTIPAPAGSAMRIYHIYADSTGASHIGTITWTPIEKPAFGKADILHQYIAADAVKAVMIAGAPNYQSPFHNTGGFHELIYVLAGSSSGHTSDGSSQVFHAGDIILLEDTKGKGAEFGFGPQGYLGLSVVLSEDKKTK
jgi:uncharacterized cupin superfamily protein